MERMTEGSGGEDSETKVNKNKRKECRLLGYKKPSSYLTGGTLRLCYRDQPVNAT
jgi:hypothetical protein